MARVFEPGVFYAPAGADLSAEANLGKFVKMSTTTVILCATAGEQAIGVLANRPLSGEPAEVHVGRVTKVRCAAALAVNVRIATDTAGKAKSAVLGIVDDTATSATDNLQGSNVMGIILEASTADVDLVSAWIGPMGLIGTTDL